MSGFASAPRRVRVERNIYRRSTGVFEIGFKDASGIQRWRTVDGGLMAARRLRDDCWLGAVAVRPWLPTHGFASVMQPTSG